MPEDIVYTDGRVSISTARVQIDGTTYALRNVTSVRLDLVPPVRGCALTLIVIGILFAFAFGAVAANTHDRSVTFLALFFVLLAMIGFVRLRSQKSAYRYVVVIASSSGEQRALSSMDRVYIERVVSSINEAIVRQ